MFYKCDPRKATQCRKRACFINGGDCAITSNPMYAEDETKPLTEVNSGRLFCRNKPDKYLKEDK